MPKSQLSKGMDRVEKTQGDGKPKPSTKAKTKITKKQGGNSTSPSQGSGNIYDHIRKM